VTEKRPRSSLVTGGSSVQKATGNLPIANESNGKGAPFRYALSYETNLPDGTGLLLRLLGVHPASPSLGGPTWVRTRDQPVMSRWLFQLSYGPFFPLTRQHAERPGDCQGNFQLQAPSPAIAPESSSTSCFCWGASISARLWPRSAGFSPG
jgi:hypothetical protein